MTPLLERFMARIERMPSGCWEWRSSYNGHGYGLFIVPDRDNAGRVLHVKAHRYSFTIHKGPIPDGGLVLHRCNNRGCVNPDHLYLGTVSDNMRDAVAAGTHNNGSKTHCKRGHEFTPENTYVSKRGFRNCRECSAMRLSTPRSTTRSGKAA